MDFEDYLSLIYTPTRAIETLSDIIYAKCNEDWGFFSINAECAEELLELTYAIKLCAKELLIRRQQELNKINYD